MLMISERNYEDLDDGLRRCGSSWNAAQAHGLISAQLAVAGPGSAAACVAQILDGSSSADSAHRACESRWLDVFEETHARLSERLSGFTLLLPGDSTAIPERVSALASWSEAYLHGLVSGTHLSGDRSATLKARLAAEPLADVIKDMLEITRAEANVDGDEDDEENAYVEIVEYLRVAAQLVYEELAELRNRPSK